MTAGRLILVVGRSGAGKDSILNGARKALADDPDVVFSRRVITRPADPTVEDHDTLSVERFWEARQAGDFALFWSAHDLHYAIPISIENDLAAGKIVVANTSRTIIAEARSRYPNTQVILVTAAPETLAARLAARGREDAKGVEKRLARSVDTPSDAEGTWIVENDGHLADALDRFVGLLQGAKPSHA
jgi:phosphonate metabolism protein PhnN/1,5-bisphosphokinase (PRPP-forming)